MQENMEANEHQITKSTSTDLLVLKNEEPGLHSSSFVEGVDGSFGSTSQQQEQEADQSNMVSLGTQIHLSEVVKTEVKEEEVSGVNLRLDPVPSENHESELQISFVEGAAGSGGDHQSISSTSESDDLNTDDEDDSSDSSSDADEVVNEDVGCSQAAESQTRRNSNRLTCSVCGMWYRQLGSLISHVWNHVYEPHGICGACGEKFVSVEKLKEHLGSHKKTYSCLHCGKCLLSSITLSRHVAKHVARSQFKCKSCNKTFSTLSALHGHSWVHLDKRPVKCHLCPKWFGQKKHLLGHVKLHARGGKHPSEDRTRHMGPHGTDGPSVCSLCNMSFVSEETLKQHMVIHSGKSPYKCFECGRCFSRRGYLNNHLKTHSGMLRWVCMICGQVSDGPEALEVHIRVHHGENQNLRPDPRSENTQEKPDGSCLDPSLMSEGQMS